LSNAIVERFTDIRVQVVDQPRTNCAYALARHVGTPFEFTLKIVQKMFWYRLLFVVDGNEEVGLFCLRQLLERNDNDILIKELIVNG
jgi:hypothetical protein